MPEQLWGLRNLANKIIFYDNALDVSVRTTVQTRAQRMFVITCLFKEESSVAMAHALIGYFFVLGCLWPLKAVSPDVFP